MERLISVHCVAFIVCDISLDNASEYDIKFNYPLKCHLINFSDNNNADILFTFDGVDLSAESKGTHLPGRIQGSPWGPDPPFLVADPPFPLIRLVIKS